MYRKRLLTNKYMVQRRIWVRIYRRLFRRKCLRRYNSNRSDELWQNNSLSLPCSLGPDNLKYRFVSNSRNRNNSQRKTNRRFDILSDWCRGKLYHNRLLYSKYRHYRGGLPLYKFYRSNKKYVIPNRLSYHNRSYIYNKYYHRLW